MRNVLFLLAPLALGTSLAQTTLAQTTDLAQPTDRTSEFNRIVSAHQQAGHYMGNVIITVDGREIYSRSVGLANVEHQVPNRVNTVFEIASITKSFTGVAVLKLQEQGKLRVTDPLSKFIPDYPGGAAITVHHLLTHTSGIVSLTALPSFGQVQSQTLTTDEKIELFKNLPPSFSPGERYEYNNSGYILLGKIIEVVSGQTYPEYLQKNVLDALGYKTSRAYSSLDLIPARASGYVLDGAELRLPDGHNVEIAGAAGQLFATSRELAQFLPGVLGGKVLNQESARAFIAPQVETHGGSDAFKHYAYGVEVGTMLGRDVVSHAGNINGFNSMMFYFPKEKMSIVSLSNREGTTSLALTTDLINAYFGAPYTIKKPKPVISVPESVLKTYVGSYKLEDINVVIEIFMKDGQLGIRMPGEGTYKLLPYGERGFLLTALGGEVRFQQGASGEELVLSVATQSFVARKQP